MRFSAIPPQLSSMGELYYHCGQFYRNEREYQSCRCVEISFVD